MVFSSLIFLFVFFPITLLIYYLAPNRLRNLILFAVSLIFYAWGEPIYITIMLFSTVFDFVNGLLIAKYKERKKLATIIFINSLVVNLGLLGFFKYAGFFADIFNSMFHLNIEVTQLPLPIGISFYTFQTMSYVIDVYLGKTQAQKNIISFGTFVTMFPQLVAGPIVKYSDVDKELQERKVTFNQFGEGIELFVRGLALKVLLANNIGLLWTSVKETPTSNLTILTAWLGIIAFAFQIYFDFRGYSGMAQGLAKMFGFSFPDNFNYPYTSKSVTEFWRRWHISLGAWFREYVYIPLGGNRVSLSKQFLNLLIVWFLTGLWHGASWNFILWGLYFCFFVTIEKLFLLKWLQSQKRVVGHVYTLLIVLIGWVFFELETVSKAMVYIKTMFGCNQATLWNNQALYYLSTNAILLIILILCSTPLPKEILRMAKEKFKLLGAVGVSMLYMILIVLSTAYLVNSTYNPFLYFRF
ncbi:MBOAT family O-acyltransferase [Bacillus wiedmannii]|uniref:MBOAT family O-acyltransferase n=1 Tax=Bacillus wiedmannii TaxID=1890302 RepID=UPI000BEDD094|nr:MBOAT family O-acyltransferase [Bacillus wiedmannii]PEF33613.1 transcriptional regulator [Bacillus wiedmannii]